MSISNRLLYRLIPALLLLASSSIKSVSIGGSIANVEFLQS